jgi:5-methylcytosine-specific restriction endonuclease McrBC regulatory subunit McrC
VTVREHERVDLGGTGDAARARDALLAATSGLREAVFRVDRRGHLHARSLVGMVQARGLTVQILPKVPAGSDPREDSRFLLRLLTAAHLVPQRFVGPGLAATDETPLLEMVIRQAAEHMQETLGAYGVPRRYEEVRDERETVVGVIDMERAMRQMPHERHRVPLIRAPLRTDNVLSRMVLSLARTLAMITMSRRTALVLADVVEQLSEAELRPLTRDLVDLGEPTVQEEQWVPEHQLAYGLCSGLLPNPTRPGPLPTRTLVFSLDDIFEKVLRRSLAACLPGSGWHLADHPQPRHFLIDTVTDAPRLRIRPDILLASDGDRRLQVADAKWKSLVVGSRGIKLDHADVYQINAYLDRFQLPRGVLLLPATDETRSAGSIPWHRRLGLAGSMTVIDIVAVDVHALVARDRTSREQALDHLRSAFTTLAT